MKNLHDSGVKRIICVLILGVNLFEALVTASIECRGLRRVFTFVLGLQYGHPFLSNLFLCLVLAQRNLEFLLPLEEVLTSDGLYLLYVLSLRVPWAWRCRTYVKLEIHCSYQD